MSDGLKWLPIFETGNPEIDDDHRKLIALANSIHEGLGDANPTLICARVEEFIDLAAAHFVREEEILVQVRFPELEEHRRYHASLMEKAKELSRVCGAVQDHSKARDCYDELMAFLIDDVVRGDMQFKSYLEHYGFARK